MGNTEKRNGVGESHDPEKLAETRVDWARRILRSGVTFEDRRRFRTNLMAELNQEFNIQKEEALAKAHNLYPDNSEGEMAEFRALNAGVEGRQRQVGYSIDSMPFELQDGLIRISAKQILSAINEEPSQIPPKT